MPEDDEQRLRLERLKASLLKAREDRRPEAAASGGSPQAATGDSGMSLAMRAGSEFISAIVLGAALGWGLDHLLGTNPAFLIAFFFLGVAAGVWMVVRLTSPKGGGGPPDSRLSHTHPADKGLRPPTGVGEPEDGRLREASRGNRESSGWADDDED